MTKTAKIPLALLAFGLAIAASSSGLAAKHHKRPRAADPGLQIACTKQGCAPIPRHCRIVPEYQLYGTLPTGFDAVVCPR